VAIYLDCFVISFLAMTNKNEVKNSGINSRIKYLPIETASVSAAVSFLD